MKYNRYSLLTMFGHLCTDINQGALPAILPFLVLHKGIDYTSAAGLIFAANSMSSFVQPFFGYMGDKVSWPWLMGLGALLAGCGLALVGFIESYWGMFAAVCVSGIGVALFHPEGGRMAYFAAGENKGAGIAVFSVGGNMGFALGPIIASIALGALGLKGTAVFLVPALAMAAAVFMSLGGLRRIAAEARHKKAGADPDADKDDWKSFFKVSACVTSRSIVAYGLTTFIPLYFTGVMMLSEASASAALTVYSVAAALATLYGGHAADRFGFARVIKFSLFILAPLMLLFPSISNAYLAILFLAPIGVAVCAPQGAIVALGQQFLPNHIGTSSGIMLGLAVSIGGMAAPGFGWVGDHYGLTMAMYAVAAFAALTMGLAFILPNSRTKSM